MIAVENVRKVLTYQLIVGRQRSSGLLLHTGEHYQSDEGCGNVRKVLFVILTYYRMEKEGKVKYIYKKWQLGKYFKGSFTHLD